MEKNISFTEGKIFVPLINFALPVLFALVLQIMYGAADMLIVGRFSSAAEVSAVSTGSWIMHMYRKYGFKEIESCNNSPMDGLIYMSLI